MCQAISREHNAWVITRKNNRQQIEQALAQHPNPHLQFRYADLPYWARFWKRRGRGIRLYYYLWQFAALREARRLMRSVHFDLAHHVTFVNSYVFSFLALVKLPFVWGPIGNNPKSPARLALNPKAVLIDRLGYGVKQLVRIVDPFYWICASRARLIVGINPDVGTQFPLSVVGKKKFINHTAIGVEESLLSAGNVHNCRNAIRVLTMGQMIPIKGFHLAIRAFVELLRSESLARLVIVGDGPEKARLEQLAAELGVAESVEFLAWLPRDEAMAVMNRADVFLFPSFEGAGMVVLEAMAHGLPVICLDFGGPGNMVTRDCGFAVKVGTLEDSVASLGAALTTLARDRSMRLEMGTSAKRHVAQNYLWRDRHEVIRQWYARVLPASSNIEEGSAVNVCPIGTRQEAVLQPGDGDKSRRLRR
jgi:glycosyltransferase involved in cell wall biosynthesis